jgi:hypothetical protein
MVINQRMRLQRLRAPGMLRAASPLAIMGVVGTLL